MTQADHVNSTPDPIVSAIENHQRAFAAYDESARHHADLEELLPPDKRESCVSKWDRTVIETDDPRWIVAEDDLMATSSVEVDAAVALVNVKPQTIAGALALVDYVTARDGWPLIIDDDGRSRSLHFFMLKNVAALLRSGPVVKVPIDVFANALLEVNVVEIAENAEHIVFAVRVPVEVVPDHAGLIALAGDDALGEKFAAFLVARAKTLQS
jgi:hypothetical protein